MAYVGRACYEAPTSCRNCKPRKGGLQSDLVAEYRGMYQAGTLSGYLDRKYGLNTLEAVKGTVK